MTGCIELSPLASSQPASQQDRAEEIKTQTIQDAIANPPSQGDEAALKADGVSSQTSGKPNGDHIPWSLVWKLYLSHFLSTWNSRSFEFGSVLFLAAIYPGTLFYLSVYAIIRSAAAIVTASPIGRAIDQRARLGVVQWSIVVGRLSVITSGVGFWAMYSYSYIPSWSKAILFAALIVLSCFEKIASVANLVSVERDWVVVIAGDNTHNLQKLNARMRRIDLICKLAGPLFIALIDGVSTVVAIWLTLVLNALSLPIEVGCIATVYRAEAKLAEPKAIRDTRPTRPGLWCRTAEDFQDVYKSVSRYFRHPAAVPSFVLSLLYLTVLSFGGQMVTYLVAAGFNSFYVGLVRSLSVIFELSATWIAPRVMRYITPIRGAMWFMSWQIGWLAATVVFFWKVPIGIAAASGLSAGTIMSRIGLWGYDLCAQTIIQSEVQEDVRGSFSTTEALFQNLFELVSYALTIALSQPEQFKYPTLISGLAVVCAGSIYARYLRQRRGHLLRVPWKAKKAPEQ